jgi:hypothetical protein
MYRHSLPGRFVAVRFAPQTLTLPEHRMASSVPPAGAM